LNSFGVCLLENVDSKISYTTDIWTATTYLAFMGITAHWINKDFHPEWVTLDFISLHGCHTGDNLGDKLVESIKEVSTMKKVGFYVFVS
jgi:hypothetical protein